MNLIDYIDRNIIEYVYECNSIYVFIYMNILVYMYIVYLYIHVYE